MLDCSQIFDKTTFYSKKGKHIPYNVLYTVTSAQVFGKLTNRLVGIHFRITHRAVGDTKNRSKDICKSVSFLKNQSNSLVNKGGLFLPYRAPKRAPGCAQNAWNVAGTGLPAILAGMRVLQIPTTNTTRLEVAGYRKIS
jgi:hypothetical protein